MFLRYSGGDLLTFLRLQWILTCLSSWLCWRRTDFISGSSGDVLVFRRGFDGYLLTKRRTDDWVPFSLLNEPLSLVRLCVASLVVVDVACFLV